MDVYKAIMVRIVQDEAYASFHSDTSSSTLVDEHGVYNGPYVISAAKRAFCEMYPEENTENMNFDGT